MTFRKWSIAFLIAVGGFLAGASLGWINHILWTLVVAAGFIALMTWSWRDTREEDDGIQIAVKFTGEIIFTLLLAIGAGVGFKSWRMGQLCFAVGIALWVLAGIVTVPKQEKGETA